jgi:hypothetical protein
MRTNGTLNPMVTSAIKATLVDRFTSEPNDEVERPRDDLWRAADIVVADKRGVVRLAFLASRTAPTDC